MRSTRTMDTVVRRNFIGAVRQREREIGRETEQVGEGQRERERENPKQALHCQHRARVGARTCEP